MSPARQFMVFSACLLIPGLAACAFMATEVPAMATPEPPVSDTPEPSPSSSTATSMPTLEAPVPTSTAQKPSGAPANADVEFVRAQLEPGGAWTFHVTVRHPDTGWEDYADGWDVLTPDGAVLKPDPESPFTRLLLHPHENEQPFTRSQRGVQIPQGVTQVRVRAHDLVSGFGGREILVDLTLTSGPGFEIIR